MTKTINNIGIHIKNVAIFLNNKKNCIKKLEASWGNIKQDDFNFDLIDNYFRKKKHCSFFHRMSDRTMNDIDFKELFSFVDRTQSRIGQQYLFNRLLTINSSHNFTEQESIIHTLASDLNKRLQTQYILSRLSDEKAFYISNLFLDEFVDRPKYHTVVKLLSIISLGVFIASLFIHAYIPILVGLFCLNLAIHHTNKKVIYMYSHSIPLLPLLCYAIKALVCCLHMHRTTMVLHRKKSISINVTFAMPYVCGW